uniref:Uncharacterized protein n=1 Tax=Arundo donax TaxID=35708 RepID=A0A0A8ZR36_ARUDO
MHSTLSIYSKITFSGTIMINSEVMHL